MKVLIIIPAYNEEKAIKNTVKSILDYNKKYKTKYDYIVINDGSTDDTLKVLEKNKIKHINLISNLGIGGAVQTGYKYAYKNGYDIAIQFDGDGQHDVSYIKKLIEPIEQGKANMVIGSRFIDKNTSEFKSTALRRVGINILSIIIKFKTKMKLYDVTSGFRAVDGNILKIFSNYYPVEYPEPISTVNVINKNYIVKEIPVKMKPRKAGVSSIKNLKSVYYMVNVILSIMLMKGNKNE